MTGCHSGNRYTSYGYLDLTILSDYAEYANSLCEFVLNTIVLDYVVRTSIRNHRSLIQKNHRTNSACVSLKNINLDTDFLSYGKKMRRICVMSKSMLYDMKTTRLAHPTWIVRFPSNFKRTLGVFACNLRNLVRKINQIEGYVTKGNLNGEILRYHVVSAALTTVKYDLLTLYVTIRSGGLTATKTSFLYPILSDTQRWLAYAYYQIKMILSSFPGSNANRSFTRRITNIPTKNCIPSFPLMSNQFRKPIKPSQISLNESHTNQLSIDENIDE